MQEQNKKNICIIGSGFAGLSAATHLVEKGNNVYILEKNSTLFHNEKIKLHQGDAVQFTSQTQVEKFDIIFADPPYTKVDYFDLKKLIKPFLNEDGVFCMEMKRCFINDETARIKKYGSTQVVFWRAKA